MESPTNKWSGAMEMERERERDRVDELTSQQNNKKKYRAVATRKVDERKCVDLFVW